MNCLACFFFPPSSPFLARLLTIKLPGAEGIFQTAFSLLYGSVYKVVDLFEWLCTVCYRQEMNIWPINNVLYQMMAGLSEVIPCYKLNALAVSHFYHYSNHNHYMFCRLVSHKTIFSPRFLGFTYRQNGYDGYLQCKTHREVG